MFRYHRGDTHHAHDQKNKEENNCNYEDWHTTPQADCPPGIERASVMPVTAGCELCDEQEIKRRLPTCGQVRRVVPKRRSF